MRITRDQLTLPTTRALRRLESRGGREISLAQFRRRDRETMWSNAIDGKYISPFAVSPFTGTRAS